LRVRSGPGSPPLGGLTGVKFLNNEDILLRKSRT
jgi:hypothetical protein